LRKYRQYQRLLTERQIARERRWAEDEAWGIGWGWGPWYRSWL
jgi:hypothetical protein